MPTLEDCARADLMTQRFVCRQFLPDHMMATCVGKLGTTCEYVCQNGYTPSGIRRCENWTLTNRAGGSEQQASADQFWGFRGGSCISAPKPTLPPRRPEQAGSTNDSNGNNGTGVSHGQFVFPNVAQVGTDAFGQYITYQLMLTFRPDYVKNVYAIFGTQGDPMRFPAAFHAPDPYGVDIGGTNPLLWGHSPSASLSAYDSWLTVGAVQWWGGETSDHLSTVGIDFETWTATQDLVVSNGAVFWTNPAAGCTQNPTLVQANFHFDQADGKRRSTRVASWPQVFTRRLRPDSIFWMATTKTSGRWKASSSRPTWLPSCRLRFTGEKRDTLPSSRPVRVWGEISGARTCERPEADSVFTVQSISNLLSWYLSEQSLEWLGVTLVVYAQKETAEGWQPTATEVVVSAVKVVSYKRESKLHL